MELKAPNDTEIQGAYELVPGSSYVTFNDGEPGYDHAGDTKMHWDGSVTQTIAGVPLFTDADGRDWPLHHLIRADAEPMSIVVLDAMGTEDFIGEALDAAKVFKDKLDVLVKNGLTREITHPTIMEMIESLTVAHANAKARTLQMMETELAFQQGGAK